MTGLDDIWPDDPLKRILFTIESVTSTFHIDFVTNRAEVTEDVARRELSRLEEKGWVVQVSSEEWRVNDDARDECELLPYE